MGDEKLVFGITIFFLTVFAISSAGGGAIFEFNFQYANQTLGGEEVGLGLDNWESQSTGDPFYFDQETEKLRINESYYTNVTGDPARPSIRYVPNVTNFESYIIDVEIPESVSNGSRDGVILQPRVAIKQGLIYIELEDGVNRVTNYGAGDFEIRYLEARGDDYDLYKSNVTSIDVHYPAGPDTGAVNLFRQFREADSGYSWFNIIALGAVSIFLSYLVILIIRGV